MIVFQELENTTPRINQPCLLILSSCGLAYSFSKSDFNNSWK